MPPRGTARGQMRSIGGVGGRSGRDSHAYSRKYSRFVRLRLLGFKTPYFRNVAVKKAGLATCLFVVFGHQNNSLKTTSHKHYRLYLFNKLYYTRVDFLIKNLLVKILFKEFHIVLICNLFDHALAIMLLHKFNELVVYRTVKVKRGEVVSVNTVNITTKGYVIITELLKAVVEVLEEVRKILLVRIYVNCRLENIKANYAALVDKRLCHIIRKVTRMIADRAEVGMCCDYGLLCNFNKIPKALI